MVSNMAKKIVITNDGGQGNVADYFSGLIPNDALNSQRQGPV